MANRLTPGTMARGLVASARTTIDAPISAVWDSLVNPKVIKQYMFGADVVSDWKMGGRIVWKGMWNGRPFEDKGTILELRPKQTLSYSHFSPLAGLPDVPENYHTVTITLSRSDDRTVVSLSQDNNPTEEAQTHSTKNWETMLATLKRVVEAKPRV